jgi:hypothetical protein
MRARTQSIDLCRQSFPKYLLYDLSSDERERPSIAICCLRRRAATSTPESDKKSHKILTGTGYSKFRAA